jgi:tetratricopeptide (TPR) repeat protein
MVLEELQRNSEAADTYRKAVQHQTAAHLGAPKVAKYRQFLSNHYFNLGRVLRRLGQVEQAADVALARRKLWPDNPNYLLAVAEELALADQLLMNSASARPRVKRYADDAIDTLREAKAAGLKLPPNFQWGDSFATLKDYPGFAELAKP